MNTLKETPHPVLGDRGHFNGKPRKIIVPLAEGLSWAESAEHIYQEKMDGRFATQTIDAGQNDTILAGEMMADGRFFAFDCLRQTGIDIRHHHYSHRVAILGSIFTDWRRVLPSSFFLLPSRKDGGAFLAEVLARGGEGVVRKRLDSPWGEIFEACKRLETFTCVVTEFNAGQSVQIARVIDDGYPNSNLFTLKVKLLTPCGSVKLGGGKCDRVRVGSILKIEGFGLTKAGQIREPRPCRDNSNSFLIKY